MGMLVGFCGKPGSRKHGALRALKERLESMGYSVVKLSLAQPLLDEMKVFIPELRETNGIDAAHLLEMLSFTHDLPISVVAQCQVYALQDLGEWNPEYGYSRSNDNVRRIMSLVAEARREADPDYYLDIFIRQVEKQTADFIMCADIRFPNEADYFNEHGVVMRFHIDPAMFEALKTSHDGEKYDQQKAESDPMESSLDDYTMFYGNFLFVLFDAEDVADELIAQLNEPEED